MATYFHGNSEIQGDHGLQTLILMNPSYVGYSDTNPQQQQQQHQHQHQHHHHHHQPPPGNFVFLNSAAAGNSFNPQNLPHAPPNHTQQFVGIPLQAVTSAAGSAYSQDISALHGFNMYSSIDPTAAREIPRAPQGLSLSLSSQQTTHGSAPTIPPGTGEDIRVSGGSPSSASGISNGVNGVQSVLLGSKYLKAAQELLDEVVNVGKGVKNELTKGMNGQSKTAGESSATAAAGDGGCGGETSGKRYGELTTAERQEIQMKKAKLVNMLDEVEQRYRQYHHQIQIVISWFEQAAGNGSAKTYTALALQTISKQFRCLKDAITGQIRSSSKSLGEEDCFGGGRNEGSRLKFVDHQLRQQRALQQLGMIQPNAWRPQRGLPERSVSVLRAWLFEHFLHPYPKDSDKVMLAKQTGLTRSQVSNWFINARVRLWKPMVEEMYMEEVKEQEHNGSDDNKTSRSENNENSPTKSNPAQNTSPVTENQNRAFMSKQNNPTNHNTPPSSISVSTASPSHTGLNIRNQPGFTLIGSPEIEGVTLRSPKKQRSSEFLQSNEQVPMKFDDERQGRDGFAFMGGPANFIGGFGSYPIGEIGRFGGEQFPGTYSGNGVSLTLGLPHCESLSMPGTHQNFLTNQTIQMGRRVEIGETNEFGAMNTPTSSHSTDVYENINLQNRKRFAAQLLPDFVA